MQSFGRFKLNIYDHRFYYFPNNVLETGKVAELFPKDKHHFSLAVVFIVV